MTTPTLRQLDIFAQMVASGSIVRCASDQGLSPQTILQDMRVLEQRLGHRLFDMSGDDIRLTTAGHRMVEAMQLLSATDIDRWGEVHAPGDDGTTPSATRTQEGPPVQRIATPLEEPWSPDPARDAFPRADSIHASDEEALAHGLFAEGRDVAPARPLRFSALRETLEDEPRPADAGISALTSEAFESPVSGPPAPTPSAPEPSAPHHRQQVTIAAHPAIFGHFQDALDAFEQTNSDVAIALELGAFTTAQIAPMLADGRVDIAYFYALGESDTLQSRYGWSEQLSLYIGVDHLLADMDLVQADDLSAVAPVLLHPANALRQITDRALAMAGVSVADPALESDNLYDVMMAVREGAGYFATFGSLARDFGRMSGIRRLPVATPLPPIEVRQAVRPEVRDDPVVAALAEYLFR
ncbi:LysR substrate-binding domain-containing protein [Sphingobium aquiterrae]|uniref:LysR substrate-binding domain-containing protein n=1 Tax=Sphingobium aquiterrae TaxID=2038656 RepID=UPI00301AC4E5